MSGEGQTEPTEPSAEALTDAIKHVRLIAFTLLTVAGLLAFFGATADVHDKAVAEAGKDPTVWEIRQLRGDWDSELLESVRDRDRANAMRGLHPDPLISEMRSQLDSSRRDDEPSFDEKYPSLAAQLDEYGYRTLDNAAHRAEAKAKAEAKTEERAVSVLGIPLDAEALPIVGPGLLFLIQLYLLVHLRHLRKWVVARQVKFDLPAPWIGVMDDRLSKTITWTGLAVLPAFAAFVSGGGLAAFVGGMFLFMVLGSAAGLTILFSVVLILSTIGGGCVAVLGYFCGEECERLSDALYDRPLRPGPICRAFRWRARQRRARRRRRRARRRRLDGAEPSPASDGATEHMEADGSVEASGSDAIETELPKAKSEEFEPAGAVDEDSMARGLKSESEIAAKPADSAAAPGALETSA